MCSTSKKIKIETVSELCHENIPFEMMTASQLNEKLLEGNKFSCVKCSGFLWPPIMLGREGNICGNCWSCSDSKASYIPNTSLENILEHIIIPCSFYENGCKEEDNYNNMNTHVKQCDYRNLNCPINEIIPKCSWKGCYKNIVDHFRKQHSSIIIRSETDSLSFPVLLSEVKDVKLILLSSGIFLLFLSYDQDCLKVLCNLYHIIDYGFKSFDLCIEQNIKDDSLVSFKTSKSNVPNILKLYDKNSQSNDVEIDLNILKGNSVKDKCEYTFKIKSKIFEENNSNKAAMLKFIECPICFQYMRSPIYQCLSGHSLCETCRKKSSCCPSCKSCFQNTRNYTLEQLINDLELPCKYKEQGCTKWCSSENRVTHEEECSFRIYNCPFKALKCDWCGKYDQLIPHLKSVHKQRTFETSYYKSDGNVNNTTTHNENINNTRCYYQVFCLIAYENVFLVRSPPIKDILGKKVIEDHWLILFLGPAHNRNDYILEISLRNNMLENKPTISFTGDFSKCQVSKIFIPREKMSSWFGNEANYSIKIFKKKTYKPNFVT